MSLLDESQNDWSKVQSPTTPPLKNKSEQQQTTLILSSIGIKVVFFLAEHEAASFEGLMAHVLWFTPSKFSDYNTSTSIIALLLKPMCIDDNSTAVPPTVTVTEGKTIFFFCYSWNAFIYPTSGNLT